MNAEEKVFQPSPKLPSAQKKTRTRWFIVFMLFLVTALNYADRATLSIAGTDMSGQLGLDSVMMGYVFSAFAWSYVAGQIPGGWLLDRFGSKKFIFGVSRYGLPLRFYKGFSVFSVLRERLSWYCSDCAS